MSRKKQPPTDTACWQFMPSVKKALIDALFKNRVARFIEMTDTGPRVRFDGFRISHRRRRVEMLFKGRVVADFPMPDAYVPNDENDFEVRLCKTDGGYLGVKLV